MAARRWLADDALLQFVAEEQADAAALAGNHFMENPLGRARFIPVTVAAELHVGPGGIGAVEFFVVPHYAAGELIEQAAHRLALADVGVGQSVGNDASDVVLVFAEQDGASHARGGHRGGDASGRGAINDDSGRIGFCA